MRTAEPLDLSDRSYNMGHTTAHIIKQRISETIFFFCLLPHLFTDNNFAIRISKMKQRRETARPLEKDMRNLSNVHENY